MTNDIVVFNTCGTKEEADRIARKLVEERIAACVNVIPQISSYYWWKGSVESAEESLLLIKTSRDLFDELRRVLESAHSYELPEVLALPVITGSPNYLAWLAGELKSAAKEEPRG